MRIKTTRKTGKKKYRVVYEGPVGHVGSEGKLGATAAGVTSTACLYHLMLLFKLTRQDTHKSDGRSVLRSVYQASLHSQHSRALERIIAR